MFKTRKPRTRSRMTTTGTQRRWSIRPQVQALEARLAPATFTVTTISDSGAGSLRDGINQSNTNGITDIVFDKTLFSTPQTIKLLSTYSSISFALTVNVLSDATVTNVTIDGNNLAPIFNTGGLGSPAGTLMSFDRLTLINSKGPAISIADESVTVTKCTFNNNGMSSSQGGAITVGLPSGSLNASNCTFSNNKASNNGGAINVSFASTITLQNCTFTGNTATTGQGGAISFLSGGSLIATGCTFTANAANGSSLGGGAIAIAGAIGALTATNCSFTSNNAAGEGGAVYLQKSSNVVLQNCTLTGNTAADNGGALAFFTGGSLKANTCTFSANSAQGSLKGGAVLFYGTVNANGLALTDCTISGNQGDGLTLFITGAANITGCTFSGNSNTGVGNGGAIFAGLKAASSALILQNCTVSGNTAFRGGGLIVTMYNAAAAVTVRNCTIVGNSSTRAGGGLARLEGSPSGGVFTISSSIIAGNLTGSALAGAADLSLSTPTSIAGDNDLIGVMNKSNNVTLTGTGHQVGVAAAPLDAKLAALANNGGPTLSHLPLPGSPARNYGNNSASLSNDQRGAGFARVLQGQADIGAIESTDPAPIAVGVAATVTAVGAAIHTITVTYTDDTGINVGSLGAADIKVIGPGGTIPVVFKGVDVGANGTPRVAIYEMVPPGGSWDGTDSGGYTISIVAGEVADIDATALTVPAGMVGSFDVRIATTFVVDLVADENDGNYAAGDLSLREAIVLSSQVYPSNDTITFDKTAFAAPQTIALTLGELGIIDFVAINGPGNLTIDAGAKSRHFNIDGNIPLTVAISGMTLQGGFAGGLGGSISLSDDNVTLSQMNLVGNKASNGGAIYMSSGQAKLTVTDCVITNNSASSAGAIDVSDSATSSGGSLIIQRSTLSGNTAGVNDGGAIDFAFGGSLTLTDSAVFGNRTSSAGSLGGGIRLRGTIGAGGFTITNSTFSGNTAGSGGALGFASLSGLPLIQNSTFTLNNAITSGGGIDSFGKSITLQSTIVAGNFLNGAPAATADLASTGGAATWGGGNNLIGIHDAGDNVVLNGSANQTGSLATPRNAQLGPLANNGGPTQTHALLFNSPAIGQGSNPVPALTTDQRGKARAVGNIDIGAFELQPAAKVTSIVVGDGTSQRSMVNQLNITFDSPIIFTGTPAAAFTLTRQSDSKGVNLAVAMDPTNTIATITFTGGAVDNKSLADGRYTLNVLAAQIGADGLDGDGTGTGGDNYTLIGTPGNGLFRLFGDSNGDGTVAANDFIAFRLALGGNSPIFDFDGDGSVAASDFIQFRLRFGGSI